MDYFSILNFKKEPFSNSPDPGIFYPSRNHMECLQSIEIAIRLKRGLSVVLGDVGAGKTTLCRKLIQQISNAAGNAAIELHLVLDPSFSTSHEFLSGIAGYFGLSTSAGVMADRTELQLKEAIKSCLFAKGVEEGKIVALLIDEGQKLPDFCLEILREFLNYETNDCKLLQIVIFAQQEFREKIGELANLANRINLCYALTPLGFRETCRMVAYRISQASEDGAGRTLFTWPGLFALYRETGGNPRSINMLCHHIVLSLIIQNRVKAGWPLVRACAGRLTLDRRSRSANLRLALTGTLIVLLSFFAVAYYGPLLKAASSIREHFQAAPAFRSMPITDASGPKKRENARSAPGQMSMGKDRKMVRAVEGAVIPAMPASPHRIPKNAVIQVAHSKTLKEAYDLLRSYAGSRPDVMLFQFRNKQEGKVFTLMMKKQFNDRTTALEALKRLTPPMPGGAGVLDTWDNDNVFYHNAEANDLLRSYARSSPDVMLFPFLDKREGKEFTLMVKKQFNDRRAALEALKQLALPMHGDARVLDTWDADTVFYHNPEDRS